MATPLAYQFGGFRFEPAEERLSRGDYVVHLTPKAAQTLLALVKRPDVVVSKEELFEAVWPGVAVEENNLNQQISTLRRVLSYEGHSVTIETVPRRGYRLIGPVEVVGPLAPAPPRAFVSEPVAVASQTRPLARIAATIAIVVVAFGAWRGWAWYQGQEAVRRASSALERGEQLLRERNAAGAVRELEEAARDDPSNARIYGALAHALAASATAQPSSAPRPAGQSPAVQAAERAVALDPTCGNCHGTLGMFLFYHDWEWARAEKHLREAIRLAPDEEGIRPAYAMYLSITGQQAEALKQIDIALQKRPHQTTWLGIRALALYYDRRYAEAIVAADQVLAHDNRHRGAWETRSKALFQLGRGSEAIHALVQDLFPDHTLELENAVREEGVEGGLRKLLVITDDWRGRIEHSWRRAPWRALLNDTDGALQELEVAIQARRLNAPNFAVDPVFDKMRGHPRFQELLADVGLQGVIDDATTSAGRR